LGDVHEGIKQMFKVIEFARMMVGTKAIATLSAGYMQALSYAKERVQGGDMKVMNDKASPRVTIIKHPDVRRSLMVQKSYSEGMRALVLYTASIQDEIELAEVSGDKDRAADMIALNDLLLPVVKGYGSEKSRHYLVLNHFKHLVALASRVTGQLSSMCAMQRSTPCMKEQLQFKVLTFSSARLLKMVDAHLVC